MKIKTGKAVKAYSAVTAMSRTAYEFETAMALYRIKKALKSVVDVAEECERALIEKTGGKPDEAGYARFANAEGMRLFEAGRRKMLEAETEADIEGTVTIKRPEQISVEQIEALEGIVEFTE